MRIAQVSPLFESVPPKAYGGTERIVSYLTEELVRQRHQVTLFASGDSVTEAELVSPCARATRLDPDCRDHLPHHVLSLEQVFARADEFDVIHFHTDYVHYPLARRCRTAHLTTMHGRLDLRDIRGIHDAFRDVPTVSISDAQRAPLPDIAWAGTVYHGLPVGLYRPSFSPGGYLCFLGRASREKGLDHAIAIARRAKLPLRIAAKVDEVDRAYFESTIRPLLSDPLVTFLGEVGERAKEELLGGAIALLFPIDWPEPFGLVMIEAMACGTPVVGYSHGSVPEILDEGLTGFVARGVEEATEAVGRAQRLDRRLCRETFEKRFAASRMAKDYVDIYRRLARTAPRALGEPVPRHRRAA